MKRAWLGTALGMLLALVTLANATHAQTADWLTVAGSGYQLQVPPDWKTFPAPAGDIAQLLLGPTGQVTLIVDPRDPSQDLGSLAAGHITAQPSNAQAVTAAPLVVDVPGADSAVMVSATAAGPAGAGMEWTLAATSGTMSYLLDVVGPASAAGQAQQILASLSLGR